MKKQHWIMRCGHVSFVPILSVLMVGSLCASVLAATPSTFEFNFAGWGPITHGVYQAGFLPWKQDVEKATNGRIKINIYSDATLTPMAEEWQSIKNGLVDMGFGMPQNSPGVFPVTDVLHLPFIGINSAGCNTRVWWDAYHTIPEIQREYKGVKILSLYGNGAYQLHTIKKPVQKLEDIRGMIVATGAAFAPVYAALGAAPAAMSWAEYYSACEKGVVDALNFQWEGMQTLKFAEVTKYHTEINLGSTVYYIAMNQSKWDKLPVELQNALMGVSGLQLGLRMSEVGYQFPDIVGIEACKKAGHPIYWMASEKPGELDKFREASSRVKEDWIKRMVDKKVLTRGRAEEILKAVMGLAQKYSKEYENWREVDWIKKWNMAQYTNWKTK